MTPPSYLDTSDAAAILAEIVETWYGGRCPVPFTDQPYVPVAHRATPANDKAVIIDRPHMVGSYRVTRLRRPDESEFEVVVPLQAVERDGRTWHRWIREVKPPRRTIADPEID